MSPRPSASNDPVAGDPVAGADARGGAHYRETRFRPARERWNAGPRVPAAAGYWIVGLAEFALVLALAVIGVALDRC